MKAQFIVKKRLINSGFTTLEKINESIKKGIDKKVIREKTTENESEYNIVFYFE